MFSDYSNAYLDIMVTDIVALVKRVPPITIFLEENECTE